MSPQEHHHLIHLSRGSKESLAFFHREYRSKVFHYCHKFVRDREVAQELCLDVFLKLWEKRSKLDTDRSVNGLLFKISRDYSLTYLRKVARSERLRKEFVENYILSVENCPVEEQIFMKEGMKIAKKAIDGLPPRCRQVFQLRYSEERSLKQIAEELNISINTVKKQLRKGTHIVKDYLRANADLVFFFIIAQNL